jgi:hypothetical protein
MGMRLFYVTVFVIFFLGGDGAAIGGFAVFLRGVLGKAAFFMWCSCGESMVDCVVIVEGRHHVAERLETCHEFEVYFRVWCGRVWCGKAAMAIPFWERCTKGLKGARFFAPVPGSFSL